MLTHKSPDVFVVIHEALDLEGVIEGELDLVELRVENKGVQIPLLHLEPNVVNMMRTQKINGGPKTVNRAAIKPLPIFSEVEIENAGKRIIVELAALINIEKMIQQRDAIFSSTRIV